MNKGVGSWSVAIVALILAIAVVAIINKLLGIDDGVTVITILLIPLIVYGVTSGTIREITAPGGWVVRFAEAASKAIGASELFDESIEPLTLKGSSTKEANTSGSSIDTEITEKRWLESGGPPILKLLLKRIDYNVDEVVSVMESLSKLPDFRFVVVTDEYDRVVAYARPQALLRRSDGSSELGNDEPNAEEPEPPGLEQESPEQVTTEPSRSQAMRQESQHPEEQSTSTRTSGTDHGDRRNLTELIEAINRGDKATVKLDPVMITETVHADSTSAGALEKMDSLNQNALLVVDKDNMYKGVIERNRIISHLMVELVKASRPR